MVAERWREEVMVAIVFGFFACLLAADGHYFMAFVMALIASSAIESGV